MLLLELEGNVVDELRWTISPRSVPYLILTELGERVRVKHRSKFDEEVIGAEKMDGIDATRMTTIRTLEEFTDVLTLLVILIDQSRKTAIKLLRNSTKVKETAKRSCHKVEC